MDNNTPDWPHDETIAGQLPSLQAYTQFCLFFPLQNPSLQAKDTITALLKATAVQLSLRFPWLSGQVINHGSGPSNSGVFTIVPSSGHNTDAFPVLVRHFPELEYAHFVAARAPMSMLDGRLLSPARDLTELYDLAHTALPVLILQVNHLDRGLILTFAAAHNAIDMTGLVTIISLFGSLCCGSIVALPDPDDLYCTGNLPLLGPHETMLDHTMLQVQPDDQRTSPKAELLSETTWAYIRFTRENLILLKESAMTYASGQSPPPPHYISTDDVVSAFLWQRITASRLHRLVPPPSDSPTSPSFSSSQIESIFCRAVNGRRLFEPPIPSSSIRHMVTCTFNSLSLQNLTTQPLASIASELRRSLNQQNHHSIRSYLTFILGHTDKSLINFAARMDLSRDLLISSGAGLHVYRVDFGPHLGLPECVRRPRWAAVEGLVYLMPKTGHGHVDAALCLSNKDWDTLLRDATWNQFTHYIG
jgi:hypothetical protein